MGLAKFLSLTCMLVKTVAEGEGGQDFTCQNDGLVKVSNIVRKLFYLYIDDSYAFEILCYVYKSLSQASLVHSLYRKLVQYF